MNKEFRGKELSINAVEGMLRNSKFNGIKSKYSIDGKDIDKVVRYVKDNGESMAEICLVYEKLIQMDEWSDKLGKYKKRLGIYKDCDVDMDYRDDASHNQGMYIKDFIDEYMHTDFKIQYRGWSYGLSMKDMIDEFHPALLGEDLLEQIMDEDFDVTCKLAVNELESILLETYVENDGIVLGQTDIDKFNRDHKDAVDFCYTDDAIDILEELECRDIIETGVIIYYSDKIDSYIRNNDDVTVEKLKQKFSSLSYLFGEDCIVVTPVKIVSRDNIFVPNYITNEYVLMSGYYTIGSTLKRCEDSEDSKSVSVCNGVFYSMLIETIDSINKLLEI